MRNLKSITVRDLIAVLQNEDPAARVVFTADYGDHCHTPQALQIRGEVEETTVTESGYSQSGFRIADDDDDDDRDDGVDREDGEKYIVIR